MAWVACALMLTLAVTVAKTVHAENGAGSNETVQARAGGANGRVSASPRLAPPVLLSVEIVPDDDRTAERNATRGDGMRCGPGMAVACQGRTAGGNTLQRAH